MKYQKRPDMVDALQFDGTAEGAAKIAQFANRPTCVLPPHEPGLETRFTLETDNREPKNLEKGSYVVVTRPTAISTRVEIMAADKFEELYAPMPAGEKAAARKAATTPKR